MHIIGTENIIGLVPKVVKFPEPRPGRTRRNGVMAAAVTRSLRHAIFAGEYAGEVIPELPLAKKFGVSEAVIHVSLSGLPRAGLVRRILNKGSFVMSMTPAEIREHVRRRLTLETMAWTDAAARGSEPGFTELRKGVAAIRDFASRSWHREDLTHAIPEHEWILALLQRADPADMAQSCRTIMEQSYGAFLTRFPAKRLAPSTRAR